MSYPHPIRLRGPWEYEPLARDNVAASAEQSLLPAADAAQSPLPPAGTIKLPADWAETLGADFRGRVRFSRRFQRPTGLSPENRVWLVIEGVDAHGTYALNGQPLGTIDGYTLPAASDITELITATNLLEIEVEAPSTIENSLQDTSSSLPTNYCLPTTTSSAHRPPPTASRPGREHLAGGPIGEVRLEIRANVFLDSLVASWQADDGGTPRLCINGRVQGAGGRRLSLIATACEREVAFLEVAAGEAIVLALPIDDWPCWPDPVDEPLLTPIELRLTSGGATLWEQVIETAPPQSPDVRPRQAMLAAAHDARCETWLDYLSPDDPAWQQILTRPTSVIGLRAVLPEAMYRQLDLSNVGVVQQLPLAWAARVCPRLAHHPSILAWCAPAAELAAFDPAGLRAVSYGRPWIELPSGT